MTNRQKTRHIAAEGPGARLAAFFDRLGGGQVGVGRAGGSLEGGEGALPERARGGLELGRETKGAIFVEYVALLLLVTVGGAAAVVSLGAPLVALARFTQLVIGLPIP